MMNRRELLVMSAALAGGAGAALAIGSCGGDDSKSKSDETVSTVQMQGDAAILNNLLDLESSAIVAYATIGERLTGRALAVARVFEVQEREHADSLRRSIETLGQPAVPPRSEAQYRATFPPLRNRRDALSFALDVESTAISAYADALGKIATDEIRVSLATILAAESEHSAVVLGELGRPQVPAAFVTGPPPQEDSG